MIPEWLRQFALAHRCAPLVADTHVLMECWVFEDASALPLILAASQGRVRLLASASTRAELGWVLERPAFAARKPAQTVLLQADRHLEVVEDPAQNAPWRCRDPGDQKFLDLVWMLKPCWLISRDRDLLRHQKAARAQGIAICPPESWLGAQSPQIGPHTPDA